MSRYILAQLPGDSELDWVSDMRALFVVDELKWKVFQSRREALQAKGTLWARVLSAMKTATIVVIKPDDVEHDLRQHWVRSGAEEGHDFDRATLIDACATALVADTPVAYLPNHLSQTLGLYPMNLFLSFDKFAPSEIKKRIGGTLRDAKVFAARAHATFDTDSVAGAGRRTVETFSHPAAKVVLLELLATQRGFDVEHPASATVLNEAAETMAKALGAALLTPGEFSDEPLVKEYNSRDVDHLQAADIAAGWAHELIALGNERSLGDTFGRVMINGRLLG